MYLSEFDNDVNLTLAVPEMSNVIFIDMWELTSTEQNADSQKAKTLCRYAKFNFDNDRNECKRKGDTV